jgi:hypothetical protein
MATLFNLWIVLSLCSYQSARSISLEQTVIEVLEVKVMSFNIRYGSARNGENRRDLVFDTFLLLPGFVFLHFLGNDKETNPRCWTNYYIVSESVYL